MSTESINIAGRLIGPAHEPFIIAEVSGNHNGSIDRAKEIIDAAAAAGADAVKLQTYTADTMTIDCDRPDFLIQGSDSPWEGRRLYELYEEAHTPWDWHQELFDYARERGIICFSTPFDATAVDFLNELGCPAFKIASFENNDLELIAKAAGTGKPLIISTGLTDVTAIADAVAAARGAGCRELLLMKCTSNYPAEPVNSNIATIPHMRALFGCQVGLSDHTLGIGVPVAAVALGATAIEKHVTLARSEGGVDAEFSLEPEELADLKVETRRSWQSIGKVSYEVSSAEQGSFAFKRSVYVVRDLRRGDLLTKENVRIIRPGFGLPPKALPILLGRRIKADLPRGTALTWDLVE